MHVLALTLLLAQSSSAIVHENFDESGGAWGDTVFENGLGPGIWSRLQLNSNHFAPDTIPELPVNVGGDKEGRLFNVGTAPAGNRITEETYTDVRLDGYFGIGRTSAFGSPAIGFRLRHGATPHAGGYVAAIYHNTTFDAKVGIGLQCNGLIHASTVLAESITFPVDTLNENHRLVFEAVGSSFSLTVFRVFVAGGVVVEEPIDLLAEAGMQNTIVGMDSTYVAGEVGFYGFTGGTNSLFMDDVTIEGLATEIGAVYCSGTGGVCPCANSTKVGEGCAHSTGFGARIAATGSTSVAAGDLRLTASQVQRDQFGILYAGTVAIMIPFGDGLRCIGGDVRRFPVQFSGTCGVLDQEGLGTALGPVAGETWYFGGWFRDPGGPCGSGFNFTPGLEITFSL